MNEIYWIQRLDFINMLIGGIILIAIVAIIGLLIATIMLCVDSCDEEDREQARKTFKYSIITSLITFVVSLGYGFIPTKKEMYEMYAIGGIIEYARDSKDIKQLPDKTVEALNVFLDDYIADKKEKE